MFMKIIKKTKQFLKENWKPIVIGGGIGLGCGAIYLLGVKNGMNKTLNWFYDATGIDLSRDYIHSNFNDLIASNIHTSDSFKEGLKFINVDIDEPVNGTFILQKKI